MIYWSTARTGAGPPARFSATALRTCPPATLRPLQLGARKRQPDAGVRDFLPATGRAARRRFGNTPALRVLLYMDAAAPAVTHLVPRRSFLETSQSAGNQRMGGVLQDARADQAASALASRKRGNDLFCAQQAPWQAPLEAPRIREGAGGRTPCAAPSDCARRTLAHGRSGWNRKGGAAIRAARGELAAPGRAHRSHFPAGRQQMEL